MAYVVSPACVACEIEQGVAILDLEKNTYFSLDPVGASVWAALSTPRALDELTQAIATEYDITADHCRQDISDLLDSLSQHGLVRTV